MSAPTEAAAPARPHHAAKSVGIPLSLGIAYGLYAAFVAETSNASDARTTTVALVGGAAVAVLSFVVGMVQTRVPRELRAAAYGVVFGCAMGYMISLATDQTWLKSGFLGLFLGLGMGLTVFYVRYTREV